MPVVTDDPMHCGRAWFWAVSILCGIAAASSLRSLAAPNGLPPDHQVLSVQSAGMERQFIVHLPSAYDNTRPMPLLVMLHGGGGTAANAIRETGWSAKADAEGFVVAYPEASRAHPEKPPNFRGNPQTWNDGSGRFAAGERNVDDIAFIRTLLDRLTAEHKVDRGRVFVTGFSNGASMAFRVGAELSDRVAAIAPVAGASWAETISPRRAVSVLYLTGTADPLNPMQGGFPKFAMGARDLGGRAKPPVGVEISRWARALSCPDAPPRETEANGVRTRRYPGCRDGAEIVFVTVEELGHVWAGGRSLLPAFMVGKPTDKLKATDVIWDFFRTHPAR